MNEADSSQKRENNLFEKQQQFFSHMTISMWQKHCWTDNVPPNLDVEILAINHYDRELVN